MVTSKARRAITSLLILGGMVVGAAPIHAADITPPRDTTSTGGSWNVTPPPTTTTLPPRVTTPTTTTIPSTPPTTVPAVPGFDPTTTAARAVPGFTPTTLPDQQPATTLPLQPPNVPTPPWENGPKPPSTTVPGTICPPIVECMPPPTTVPMDPVPVEPSPLPRDFAANDAGALRDGLRIYRQAKLVELAETGASCLTFSCVNEIRQLCSDLGQAASWVEVDGGWDVFCWEGNVSPQFVSALVRLAARHGRASLTFALSSDALEDSDDDDTCFEAVPLVCGEIDGEEMCIYTVETVPCEEEEGGSSGGEEAPAPKPNAELGIAAGNTAADTGMSCATVDCMADFVQWCLQSGGTSVTEVGPDFEGWYMNCDLTGEGSTEAEGASTSPTFTLSSDALEDEGDLVCWEAESTVCLEIDDQEFCIEPGDIVCEEEEGGSSGGE